MYNDSKSKFEGTTTAKILVINWMTKFNFGTHSKDLHLYLMCSYLINMTMSVYDRYSRYSPADILIH